jgi:hypothetical protein
MSRLYGHQPRTVAKFGTALPFDYNGDTIETSTPICWRSLQVFKEDIYPIQEQATLSRTQASTMEQSSEFFIFESLQQSSLAIGGSVRFLLLNCALIAAKDYPSAFKTYERLVS